LKIPKMKPFFIPRLPEDKAFTLPLRARAGYTLVEALLTISILGLVMVAMIPFIRTVHTAWNLGDRKTELQQNARVGLEMMSRFIRQAKRITGIPSSGSGNFVKFRTGQVVNNIFLEDAQTIIFYHNIPGSAYYIGNVGLIKVNDLVMRTIDISGTVNNALLAKSLTNFKIDYKDAQGGVASEPYRVNSLDISMSLSDPQGLIPDQLNIFSTVSIRPAVRINRPVWASAGNYVAELFTDNWITGFSSAASISVNPSTGECWVADTNNNRVKKLSSSGSVSVNVSGFSQPASVSGNPTTGECWVADTNNNRIKKLSSSGAVVLNLRGFSRPNSVSVNPTTGECWVADTNNNRIKKLSSSGSVSVNVSGFSRPASVSVNPTTGECWVADTNNNRIKKLSASGAVSVNLTGFRRPQAVSVNPTTRECWVADTNNNRVKKLSSGGSLLVNVTGFSSPRSVSVNSSDGSSWVADNGNNQIVKLDSEGNEEFRISGFQLPLSVADSR